MAENLIQAGNIVASIFYGVILGLFIVAFFMRWIGGNAVFIGAVLAQTLVLVMYYTTPIAYLWYNVIGPAACVAFSLTLQALIGTEPDKPDWLDRFAARRELRAFPVIFPANNTAAGDNGSTT
jgi:hypothetical protein